MIIYLCISFHPFLPYNSVKQRILLSLCHTQSMTQSYPLIFVLYTWQQVCFPCFYPNIEHGRRLTERILHHSQSVFPWHDYPINWNNLAHYRPIICLYVYQEKLVKIQILRVNGISLICQSGILFVLKKSIYHITLAPREPVLAPGGHCFLFKML